MYAPELVTIRDGKVRHITYVNGLDIGEDVDMEDVRGVVR